MARSPVPADRSQLESWLKKLGLHRPELRAWAMYDWANSAFATTMMAAVLPVYFHDVAAATLEPNLRTAYWGYITGFALLLVAVASPLLGAVADYLGKKKLLLAIFTLVGAFASAAMMFVYHGDWPLAAVLFILGNIGFSGANIFYDSLLPHIATEEECDRVSTAGYALGYLGGGVLLAINLLWITKPELFGMADKGVAVRLSFLSVGIWWLGFSVPLLRRVREPQAHRYKGETGHYLVQGWKRVGITFHQIRRYKQVMIFLIGYWFYTDGIGTIMKMASIYGREIGIDSSSLIGALLLTQLLGIPATFAFGSIASRLGAKKAIILALLIYTGICVLGFFMTEAWHFWILAGLVALVQGGSQALSRSLYAAIVPPSKSSEFFAFVSISARFAGVLGPLMFGVVAQTMGGGRASILLLVGFFVVGIYMLMRLDIEEGRRVAQEAELELVTLRQ